jgi:DNA-binding response OmpR family regulator
VVTSSRHILIVDDDPDIAALLRQLMFGEGHTTSIAQNGEMAESLARARNPDLVILDLNLPGISGIEVCRRLRGFLSTPILMLTASGSDESQLVGFSAGADDYVSKPFNTQVLIARIRALLARGLNAAELVIHVDNLSVNPSSQIVTIDDQEVSLSKIEFDMLVALAQRRNRIVSKEVLIREVWGEWFGDNHVVETTLSRLRAKLTKAGASSAMITTRRGIGYRLGTAESN